MILSRARPFSRATSCVISSLLQGSGRSNLKQAVRTKAYVRYRNGTPPDDFVKSIRKPNIIFSAALWWWITWRLFADWEELEGPHIPKMSSWTDEELGIPPLDEDP